MVTSVCQIKTECAHPSDFFRRRGVRVYDRLYLGRWFIAHEGGTFYIYQWLPVTRQVRRATWLAYELPGYSTLAAAAWAISYYFD